MRLFKIAGVAVAALALVAPSANAAPANPGAAVFGTKNVVVKNAFKMSSSKAQAQAFAYDGKVLYTVQLATASAAHQKKDSRWAAHHGNLIVTRTSDGKSMILNAFGHGVSLAVEHAATGEPYLWVETAAPVTKGDANSFGTKIARVKFAPGKTYSYNFKTARIENGKKAAAEAAVLAGLSSRPGSKSVSIDPTTGQLGLRYYASSTWRIEVYDLARAKVNDLSVNLAKPGLAMPHTVTNGHFQGWALCQSVVYSVETDKKFTKAVFASWSTTTGAKVNQATSLRGKHYSTKGLTATPEPEGLAIYAPAGSSPKLRWGLAGKPGGVAKLKIFERA